ncbi:vacuolar iron transporter homolog 2-like [Rutidosis leptorrhynchoides]|uniref:vacuolar iron transporter homolog 2-like n=1 Tax=Rutidosis leptorrhynchoides TaxID=125765 RepID=UPI003A98F667
MVHDSPTTHEGCGEHTLPIKKELTRVERLQRAQWLRAAILGANDGLLSSTSLMMGVGAAQEGQWFMVLSGVAGAVAGACSMAVGEFVSVSTQRDIELAVTQKNPDLQEIKVEILKNDQLIVGNKLNSPVVKVVETNSGDKVEEDENESLPNPYKAAAASASAFLCGSLFPLAAAMAVNDYNARIATVVVVTSIALALFGGVGAILGGSCVRASTIRVLIGGWISMAVTYGLLKPLDGITDKKMHES